MKIIDAQIQLRRDARVNWEAANPVLAEGEIGLVTDGGNNDRGKIGDGVTPWNQLAYTIGSLNVLSFKDGLDEAGNFVSLTQIHCGTSQGNLDYAVGQYLLVRYYGKSGLTNNVQIIPYFDSDTNPCNPSAQGFVAGENAAGIPLSGQWIMAGYYRSNFDYLNNAAVLIRRIA